MSNGIYPVLPVGAYPANTQAIATAHLQNNFESNPSPVAPQPDKLQAALAGTNIPVQKIGATDPQIPKQSGNPKDPTGQTGQKLYCLA